MEPPIDIVECIEVQVELIDFDSIGGRFAFIAGFAKNYVFIQGVANILDFDIIAVRSPIMAFTAMVFVAINTFVVITYPAIASAIAASTIMKSTNNSIAAITSATITSTLAITTTPATFTTLTPPSSSFHPLSSHFRVN